ncbi:MAG: hypothetical protein K9G39_00710 [Chlorobium sp.]|uniref:hypothetical protein n=1 Tax=Chlorobium sp. TaxID=1095 RepID=UPI0025C11506|nr:hypothetical protein [Chlorobium sp.]MCF8382106.1 hypothetical protein [Chlorobium sp.]
MAARIGVQMKVLHYKQSARAGQTGKHMSRKRESWGSVTRIADRAFRETGPVFSEKIFPLLTPELSETIADVSRRAFESDFINSQEVRCLMLSLYNSWVSGNPDMALHVAEIVADQVLHITGTLQSEGIEFDNDGRRTDGYGDEYEIT